MRIRFFERLLSALSGLIILFLGVSVLVVGLGIFPFRVDVSMFDRSFALLERLVIIGSALLLIILGFHSLSILFRRRKDRGFIMQHTELGDMSISMHAMENMVKRCIDTHEELKVSHTRIHRTRDGVAVDIRVSLANGVNIPLTVNALQKQIKHYITSCSGVDVKEVRVMVETSNSQRPKSAEVFAPDLAAAEAYMGTKGPESPDGFPIHPHAPAGGERVRTPIHQRIFKREEVPQIVPPPPVVEEVMPPAAKDISHPAIEDAASPVMVEFVHPEVEEIKPPMMEEIVPPVVQEAVPPVAEEITPTEGEDADPSQSVAAAQVAHEQEQDTTAQEAEPAIQVAQSIEIEEEENE